jgi:PTH1 family peptidyl-tRNA hydrolase
VAPWFRRARNPQDSVRAIVLGVGNPGQKYAGTRHNVGFAVIDELRSSLAARPRGKRHEARVWLAGDVLLAKPETFVNLSGRAARQLCAAHKVDPTNLLVLADDVNLRLGQLRLRREGSAGGHKGLRSIVQELGTQDVPRLRVGVGRPPDPKDDLVEHVLSPFPPDQEELARETIRRAAQCVEVYLRDGVEAAMDQFNS